MDGVVFDVVRRDRTECAKADMQGEIGERDALRARVPAEQLRGEMQAGGRRGGGDLASAVGIHRLVTFAVGGCRASRVM